MSLRSGVSVWERLHGQPKPYPQLQRDAACDVLIVGGGISGAIVSAFLARAGMKVILIDRDQPIAGSTLACTGLLQYELDVPLTKLRDLIGAAGAEHAYQGCWKALRQFPEFVTSIDAESAVISRPSLYVAGSQLSGEAMREEAAEREALGIDVDYLAAPELATRFNIPGRDGAILSRLAFGVDPVSLAEACLRSAASKGARIFGATALAAHDASPAGVSASTAHGPVIRARHIVFATGYAANQLLDFPLGTRSRTFALATPPAYPNPWPQSALLWEAANPYFYARTVGDRICVGGGDVPDDDASEALLDAKADQLLAALQQIRPDLTQLKVETAWSGTFITTKDGLPFIGAVDRFREAIFVLGYSGNGILFSFLAAQIVLNRLLGREHPLADLVGFSSARMQEQSIY